MTKFPSFRSLGIPMFLLDFRISLDHHSQMEHSMAIMDFTNAMATQVANSAVYVCFAAATPSSGVDLVVALSKA